MLEEIRQHDATPTAEEREWLDFNPFTAAVRIASFIAFALALGGYLSLYFDLPVRSPSVAAAAK